MSEFIPITTLNELISLDADMVNAGYHAGRRGDPEPGNAYPRDYWHGWRNGAIDAGRRREDAATRALIADQLTRYRNVSRRLH